MSITPNTQDTTVYFDDAAYLGLGNNGSITLSNNCTMVVDSDVRWGQNAAVPGAVSNNSTSGGNFTIDGTRVWWQPFKAATGNVPALGTRGTNDVKLTDNAGALVGEFLGIWPDPMGYAPLASGGAIPTRGYVKFRNVSQTFSADTVLYFTNNAATVTCDTGGQRGWLHYASSSGMVVIPPGRVRMLGDWFQLGVIDGSYNQTFQLPISDSCPAVQVETGSGTGVYEWWLSAGPPGGTTSADVSFKWGASGCVAVDAARGKYFGMKDTGEIEFYRRLNGPSSVVRYTVLVVADTNQTGTQVTGTANGTGGTFTYTANGALTIDGVALALNDRVLLAGQTTSAQNGVYYVSTVGNAGAPGVLTRANDHCRLSKIQYAEQTFFVPTAGTLAGTWYAARNNYLPDQSTSNTVTINTLTLHMGHCRAATTAALSNSPTYSAGVFTAGSNGALTLDGITPTYNERLLIKDQVTTVNNGIYVVTDPGSASTPYVLTRAADMAIGLVVPSGTVVNIRDGTVQKGWRFRLNTITVGTNGLNPTRISDSFLGSARLTSTASVTPVGTALVSPFHYSSTTTVMSSMGEGRGTPGFTTCRAATTAALTITTPAATTLTGTGLLPTIDGISSWTASGAQLAADKILLKDQAAPAENGVYYLSANSTNFVLTRVSDFTSTSTPLKTLNNVFVYGGTANINTWWSLTGTVNTVGTDAVNWASQSAPSFAPARLATNAALPTYTGTGTLTASANGALTVDGVAVAVGDRIVVKDEATAARGGIYTVSATGDGSNPWVLARAADFDTGVQPIVEPRDISVTEGQINRGRRFYLDGTVTTVDTTAVNWVGADFLPCSLATTAVLLSSPTYNNGAGTLTASVGTGAAFTPVKYVTGGITGGYVNGVFTNTGTVSRFVIDSCNVAVGDRVLLVGNTSSNGIYTVTNDGTGSTNFVLTRVDLLHGQTWTQNTSVYVQNGATNMQTYWYISAANGTVGSGNMTWTQGGLWIDGVVPEVGDRLLVKNESTAANRGIYTVTTAGPAYVLTRTTDWATAVQPIRKNRVIKILNGLTLSNTYWYLAAEVTTIGTTSVTLTQTTADLTLDGVKVQMGDSVLLTGQAINTQNGLFAVNSNGPYWSLSRHINFTAARQPIFAGSFVTVNCFETSQLTDVRLATRVALPNFPTYNAGTLTLTATTYGALEVDRLTVIAGDRILVKNQTNLTRNGIYVVTTVGDASTYWVLTRASDFNTSFTTFYHFVFVVSGLVNLNTSWVLAEPFVLDSTRVFFISFVTGTTADVSTDVVYSVNGKVNTIDSSSITFTTRGSSCGYQPPVGARVRVPNIFLSNAVIGTGDYAVHKMDTTRSSLNGCVSFDLQIVMSCSWGWNFSTANNCLNNINIQYLALGDFCNWSVMSASISIDNLVVGLVALNGTAPAAAPALAENGSSFTLSTSSATVAFPFAPNFTLSNLRLTRVGGTNSTFLVTGLLDGLTLNDCRLEAFMSAAANYTRGSGQTAFNATSTSNIVLNNCTIVGGQISAGQNLTVNNLTTGDRLVSVTSATQAIATIAAAPYFVSVTGYTIISTRNSPSFLLSGSFDNVIIQNIGSATAPLNVMGMNAFLASSLTNRTLMRNIFLRNISSSNSILTANVLNPNTVYDKVWIHANQAVNTACGRNFIYRSCRFTDTNNFNSVAFGRHCGDAYINDTQGRITFRVTRNTVDNTQTSVALTGTAAFATATVNMPNIGDSITWTISHNILGYTQLVDIAVNLTGTYSFTYQIDINDGAGFKSGAGVNTFEAMTVANLAQWTLSPTVGFKLKVRCTTTVFSTSNSLTYVYIVAQTTPALQNAVTLYGLSTFAFTITGAVNGSRVQVYNTTTNLEVLNTTVSASPYTASVFLPWVRGDTLRLRVTYAAGTTAYLPYLVTLNTSQCLTDPNFTVSQVLDTNYTIDGSTVSEATANYTTNEIVINDPDNTTTLQRLYCFFTYQTATNSTAIANWFQAFTLINSSVALLTGLKLSNSKSATCTLTGGTLYRSDGADWVSATTTGPFLSQGATFALQKLINLPQNTVYYDNQPSRVYYL